MISVDKPSTSRRHNFFATDFDSKAMLADISTAQLTIKGRSKISCTAPSDLVPKLCLETKGTTPDAAFRTTRTCVPRPESWLIRELQAILKVTNIMNRVELPLEIRCIHVCIHVYLGDVVAGVVPVRSEERELLKPLDTFLHSFLHFFY